MMAFPALARIGLLIGLWALTPATLAENPPLPATLAAPFAADSCWKTVVPADVTYRNVQFEFRKFDNKLGINWRKWTVGIYQARPGDPEVTVHLKNIWKALDQGEIKNWGNPPAVEAQLLQDSTLVPKSPQPPWATQATMPYRPATQDYRAQIHCPVNAHPSPDSDGHLVVLQPDGKTLFTAYGAAQLANGDIVCSLGTFVDLAGPGAGTQCGVRASMIPSLAGLIRKGELARGAIPHALSGVLYAGCLKWGTHVWPAISHDTRSGYAGSIPLGSRLAIPHTTDLTKLGLSPKGLIIATALQHYGLFLVDRGGEGMTLLAELGDDEVEYPEWWRNDSAKIIAQLAVVDPPATGPQAVQFSPDWEETHGLTPITVNPPAEPTLTVGAGGSYTQIAAALAALPPTGGTIRVAEGTYPITQELKLPSNVALLGAGPKKTIITLAAEARTHLITNADWHAGNHNILIRDLALIGNLNSGGQPPIGKPTQGNDNCRGIYFNNVSAAWVERVFLSETGSNSLRADNSRRLVVVNNTESYCFHCLNFTNCEDVLYAGNTTYRKWSGEAPYLNNTHHSALLGNSVEGVGMDGITLDFGSHHNYVAGNTVVGAYLSGLLLTHEAHDNLIRENTLRNCGQYRHNPFDRADGICLDRASNNCLEHNWISDDQMKPSQRHGIYLRNAACKGNQLLGNWFLGNGDTPVQDQGIETVVKETRKDTPG